MKSFSITVITLILAVLNQGALAREDASHYVTLAYTEQVRDNSVATLDTAKRYATSIKNVANERAHRLAANEVNLTIDQASLTLRTELEEIIEGKVIPRESLY